MIFLTNYLFWYYMYVYLHLPNSLQTDQVHKRNYLLRYKHNLAFMFSVFLIFYTEVRMPDAQLLCKTQIIFNVIIVL